MLSSQVEFRERLSAAGRLPVRPDRRERAGTEREVLAARIVDRALRPLINPGFLYDTQVSGDLVTATTADWQQQTVELTVERRLVGHTYWHTLGLSLLLLMRCCLQATWFIVLLFHHRSGVKCCLPMA